MGGSTSGVAFRTGANNTTATTTRATSTDDAVQQDETALVLWSLREHFRIYRDVEFLKPLYNSIVIPCANWLLDHRDHHGLPKPSWDLWEERRGVHTFTVAATIGALKAAAEFARDMGAMDHEERFLAGARRKPKLGPNPNANPNNETRPNHDPTLTLTRRAASPAASRR